MVEYKFDTQLLIEGQNLDEDAINEYFVNNFKGDCLLAVGDDELAEKLEEKRLEAKEKVLQKDKAISDKYNH